MIVSGKSSGALKMWFQKQRAEREERRGRQKRKEQPLKQEATSLEKAKREYDLWVLAEEYEEDR